MFKQFPLTLLLLPFPLPQIALGWALPNCYYARARTRPGCSIIYHKMLWTRNVFGQHCRQAAIASSSCCCCCCSPLGRKSPERKATKTFTQKRSRARAVKGIKRTVVELHSVHVQAAFIKITVLKYALSKLQLSSTTTYNMPHATLNKQKSQDVERGGEYTKTGTEQCGNLKRGRREELRMIEKGREGRRKG